MIGAQVFWVLLIAELLCLAALLWGIWLIYPPAAYIVGGAVGIYALERLSDRLEAKP